MNKIEFLDLLVEKAWMLVHQAEELETFINKHGDKHIDTSKSIMMTIPCRDIRNKFSILSKDFEDDINIFNLKKGE